MSSNCTLLYTDVTILLLPNICCLSTAVFEQVKACLNEIFTVKEDIINFIYVRGMSSKYLD